MNYFRLFLLIIILPFFSLLSSFAQENTLGFYINLGLKNSPVLNEFNNQLSSNSIDSLLVKAGQKPQVKYNGLLYYAPVINGIGYSEAITNVSNITSVVYASQTIFNQKTIDAQYSRINLQNQELRNSSKISENDLRKAITLQYLSACGVMNEINFNTELLSSSKTEESILRQLVEKGVYKQVDYFSFMVEFKSQQLLLNDLQIQYRKEISALNLLCGRTDTSALQLTMPDIQINAPGRPANSPYFTRFIVDSLKIQNQKLLIDRSYKPSVNWFSDAGLLNNLPQDIYKSFGVSLGLNATFPIYDGQQKKLNYDKLKIAENIRAGYAGYFRQQFSQQQQQLLQELEKVRAILPVVAEQQVFMDAIIRQDNELLNSGNISITDYVTALKNYSSVKRNLNQYRLRVLEIITEINYWNQ